MAAMSVRSPNGSSIGTSPFAAGRESQASRQGFGESHSSRAPASRYTGSTSTGLLSVSANWKPYWVSNCRT